jgi:hypothetical protein
VVAPPAVPGGKFRVLHKCQWRGMDFEAQAEAIRQVAQQYKVTYTAIDTTGIGQGVYPLGASSTRTRSRSITRLK